MADGGCDDESYPPSKIRPFAAKSANGANVETRKTETVTAAVATIDACDGQSITPAACGFAPIAPPRAPPDDPSAERPHPK